MPYVKKGTAIYKKVGGKLVKVGQSTAGKVKSYLRTLLGVEHGWTPTNK